MPSIFQMKRALSVRKNKIGEIIFIALVATILIGAPIGVGGFFLVHENIIKAANKPIREGEDGPFSSAVSNKARRLKNLGISMIAIPAILFIVFAIASTLIPPTTNINESEA